MDTSTLSPTDKDVEVSPNSPASLTSAIRSQSIQPGLEWFTRLLAPLTRHTSTAIDRTSAVTATAPIVVLPQASASSRTEGTEEKEGTMGLMMDRKQFEALLQQIQSDAEVGQSHETPAAQQDPWIGQPTYPARVEAGTGAGDGYEHGKGLNIVLLVFIPILAVVLTILLGLMVFLVAMLYMRRKRGIKWLKPTKLIYRLTEDGGPLDLSKGDGVIGEGGVPGVESRWLETVDPDVREAYRRAKEWQSSYPPSSVPTDITLSQFLSIQEKGVSAWSFEPDYEDNLSLYVQSRTEITFLSDGPGMAPREGGGNSVMANLPLPKVNEVYYWEVKLYDKAPNTEVAIGLATKPYPSFRLPGWSKYSVAYFASDGFKSHNYPFTASSHGPPLREGDVLGVGYRPRTGTVFFTRNGRKMEDAYTGLQRFNLFPVVGANGPCTLHVNLGQAGFVFIEANVKKWGLAPMVGTLAPPPAYGSERGSILLDAGYGTPGANAGQSTSAGVGSLLEAARNRATPSPSTGRQLGRSYATTSSNQSILTPTAESSPSRPIPKSPVRSNFDHAQVTRAHSARRHRRAGKSTNLSNSIPAVPSPLRGEAGPGPSTAGSRRRALTRPRDEADEAGDEGIEYVSPTDTPYEGPRVPSTDEVEDLTSESDIEHDDSRRGQLEPESPMEHNPPTPNPLDFSLHSLKPRLGQYFPSNRQSARRDGEEEEEEDEGYSSDGSDEHLVPAHQREEQDARLSPGGRSGRSGNSQAGSDDTIRPTQTQGGREQEQEQRSPLGPPSGSPPPPGYAPLDPNMYAALPANLPDELVNQAIAAMTDSEQANRQNASAQPATPEARPSGTFGWFRRGG